MPTSEVATCRVTGDSRKALQTSIESQFLMIINFWRYMPSKWLQERPQFPEGWHVVWQVMLKRALAREEVHVSTGVPRS